MEESIKARSSKPLSDQVNTYHRGKCPQASHNVAFSSQHSSVQLHERRVRLGKHVTVPVTMQSNGLVQVVVAMGVAVVRTYQFHPRGAALALAVLLILLPETTPWELVVRRAQERLIRLQTSQKRSWPLLVAVLVGCWSLNLPRRWTPAGPIRRSAGFVLEAPLLRCEPLRVSFRHALRRHPHRLSR